MSSLQLSQGLIDHFRISSYKQATTNGGQKTVFMVVIDDVKYALKIIHIADERFEREVKICEQFTNNVGIPTILRIEKYLTDTIILEEYIDGYDLHEVHKKYHGNSEKTLNLIFEIATILKPVWDAKYVHRDLKPQNIRIRNSGEAIVLDFGIARALNEESITASGGQPLSWLFASPEQYAGNKHLISYKTDFFCLGIMAHYLFTGKLPFGHDKVSISDAFSRPLLKVDCGNVKVDNFCNAVFYINPSDRPRKIQSFLNLVKL